VNFLVVGPLTEHVRNEEVLLRVNERRNILHEIRKRKVMVRIHLVKMDGGYRW
jgi:hypothetical protein